MPYQSPFGWLSLPVSPFEKSPLAPIPGMEFHGTLEQVLFETKMALRNGGNGTISGNGRNESESLSLALHPSRIIRAVIDYKIEHPENKELEKLLNLAIDVALDMYAGKDNVEERIDGFQTMVYGYGAGPLLTLPLVQPSDITTLDASNGEKSEQSAARLTGLNQDGNGQRKPVLFIALAHGGVAAGMEVYLKYCDLAMSEDSTFYAVRFSRMKKMDAIPRLSAGEIDYLRNLSRGKQVVLFDEDRASGVTLDSAHHYFSHTVFPSQTILVLTNLDMKVDLILSKPFSKTIDKIESSPLYNTLSHKDKHDLISGLHHLLKGNQNIPQYHLIINTFLYSAPSSLNIKEHLGGGIKEELLPKLSKPSNHLIQEEGFNNKKVIIKKSLEKHPDPPTSSSPLMEYLLINPEP